MCLSDLKSEAAGFGQKVVQQRSVTMCFKTLKETDLKEEPKRPDASRCNLCVSGYESESKIIRRQMFQEPWKQELETSSTALPLLRKQWCKKGSLAVCVCNIYIDIQYILVPINDTVHALMLFYVTSRCLHILSRSQPREGSSIQIQVKGLCARIVMICDAPTLHRKLTGEPIRGVQICFNRLEIVYNIWHRSVGGHWIAIENWKFSHLLLRRLHDPKPPTLSKTSVVKAFTECLKFQRWKNYDKM